MTRFILNETTIETDLPPGMVLLDFIRYHQHLMGTKIGCREGDCGACTVLIGELADGELQYESMTSCLLPLGNVQGKHVVTIEGLNLTEGLNPIQQAMADEGATQCGFCTPGFVVSLAGFCLDHREQNYKNAIAAIDGNICRCTGYKSIERAAAKVARLLENRNGSPGEYVSKNQILPAYFSRVKANLQTLKTNGLPLAPGKASFTVAGGTDLYVQKHDELTHADIDFVFDNPAFNTIRVEGTTCILGPAVTVTDLKNSQLINDAFPSFQQYARLISSTPIRNMATIAGNFVNASPIGDFTIFFLALDAEIGLSAMNGKNPPRKIKLRDFYKGYKQLNKEAGELITEISFQLPGNKSFFHFEKVSKRTHLDIASVNSAIHIKTDGNRIAKASLSAGGVGPVPMYLKKTSAFLEGKEFSADLVEEAIAVMKIEISPISDARGTKEYKTLLLGQLIKAHWINASFGKGREGGV